MVRKLLMVAAFAVAGAGIVNASATGTTYPTPEEAAVAGLMELLGGQTIAGQCLFVPRDDEHFGQVCYSPSVSWSGEAHFVYTAEVIGYADKGWWVGAAGADDLWRPYDGGSAPASSIAASPIRAAVSYMATRTATPTGMTSPTPWTRWPFYNTRPA
jgi:hypothetical protein